MQQALPGLLYGNNSAQEIQLVADKSIYTVGDTAYIMLQSPLPQGQYLISVEREGIFLSVSYVLMKQARFWKFL